MNDRVYLSKLTRDVNNINYVLVSSDGLVSHPKIYISIFSYQNPINLLNKTIDYERQSKLNSKA